MADLCTVNYEVYPPTGETLLHDLLAQCLVILQPLTTRYIWQQDALRLTPSTSHAAPWHSQPQPPCLWGTSCVGESVQDEWFITALLRCVTRALPDIAARVWDDDGEFVLIEAAYSLPRWLNPDRAPNRVWWLQGQLHLVPLPSPMHPNLPTAPTLHEALAIVRSPAVDTTAGEGVADTLIRRMAGLPEDACAMLNHTAHVLLPVRLAAMLNVNPQIIAAITSAFYHRDVDAMAAFARHAALGVPTSVDDMVTVAVRFNKAHYAQLAMQRFEPPKRFPMPPTASPLYDAAILGLKLTAGLEMLLVDAGLPSSDAQAGADDQPSGPAWTAFEASLVNRGYFQDLLPGSVGYQQRLQQARMAFGQAGLIKEGPAERAARLFQSLQHSIDVEAWRAQQGPLAAADDDHWMRDGAADLEAELAGRQAERDAQESARQQVAERVTTFVEGLGDLEGAEIPETLEIGVDVSMDAVLSELRTALGVAGDAAVVEPLSSEDEGSSFFSDPSDDDDDDNDHDEEEEGDMAAAGPSSSGGVEKTSGFFAAYLDELEAQLRDSTVPKTFAATGDTPVDVDANLVANLLASVDMQQGLAGPASNLAGMVGLDVEPGKKK